MCVREGVCVRVCACTCTCLCARDSVCTWVILRVCECAFGADMPLKGVQNRKKQSPKGKSVNKAARMGLRCGKVMGTWSRNFLRSENPYAQAGSESVFCSIALRTPVEKTGRRSEGRFAPCGHGRAAIAACRTSTAIRTMPHVWTIRLR